jgi:hypothetical protein
MRQFKLLYLLLAIACMVPFVSADHNDEFIRHSEDAVSMADGTYIGLSEQMFELDGQMCFNYSMVLFWNGLDSIKYIFVDPYLGIESILLIIHKFPLVVNQCETLANDFRFIENVFTLFNGYNNVNLIVTLWMNFVFNIGDMV